MQRLIGKMTSRSGEDAVYAGGIGDKKLSN